MVALDRHRVGQACCWRWLQVYLGKWRETNVAVKLLIGDDGSVGQAMSPTNPLLVNLQRVGVPRHWRCGALHHGIVCKGQPPHCVCYVSLSAPPHGPLLSPLCSKLQEASILATLRHPNVVQFMGICTAPPCLVLEYCPRGSLLDLINDAKKRPALAQQLDWTRRLNMASRPPNWPCLGAQHCWTAHSISCRVVVVALMQRRKGSSSSGQAGMVPACVQRQPAACTAVASSAKHALPTAVQAVSAAQGMLYLHSCTPPVLHRDLKSGNFLVTSSWTVKVCWGLCVGYQLGRAASVEGVAHCNALTRQGWTGVHALTNGGSCWSGSNPEDTEHAEMHACAHRTTALRAAPYLTYACCIDHARCRISTSAGSFHLTQQLLGAAC